MRVKRSLACLVALLLLLSGCSTDVKKKEFFESGKRFVAALYVGTGRDALAEKPLKVVVEATQSARAKLALADYWPWCRSRKPWIRIQATPCSTTISRWRSRAPAIV